MTVDQLALHYLRDGYDVERSLAAAERNADDHERQAANLRRAIAAVREALDG